MQERGCLLSSSRGFSPDLSAAAPQEIARGQPPCKPDSVPPERRWWPSICDPRCRGPPAAYPGVVARRATAPPLFGIAPGGACQAGPSPDRWWSLTPPFQLNLPPGATLASMRARAAGLFFSVALSVGSPRLDVIQHPALWSPDFPRGQRPRGHPDDCPHTHCSTAASSRRAAE